MNIFHKVTLESLRKNRTRTIVTIIGIILSTALICAVTTSVSSFQNYLLQNYIDANGNWHGALEGESADEYKKLRTSEEIEEAFYARRVGYAEIGSQNEFKPYLYITSVSGSFLDNMPVYITEGTLPTNHKEILLPDHLAQNGKVTYSVGDTLTLEIGKRTKDGATLWQRRPNYIADEAGKAKVTDEILTNTYTQSYTVVGFYERPDFEPMTAPGYTAITVTTSGLPQDAIYDIYFRMKDPKAVYDFVEDHRLDANLNSDVLLFSGASRFDSFYAMLYGLAAIIIGLVMFGSVSLIYNAFAISVSERTKQFGLLSSIGATKKQLRRMVFFEGFAVSLIGIPAGILLGVAGIGITLHIIGEKFLIMLGGRTPMRICVTPAAILIACAVALLTVMLSAWIPSRRATRVTAVEAIRQSNDIKAEKKPIRTPKLISKLFGLPGMLAHKHYKRSKKKYRATVVSLFMSIVLFISASAFTDYLIEAGRGGFSTYGFDIEYTPSALEMQGRSIGDFLTMLSDTAHVEKAAYAKYRIMFAEMPKTDISDEALANADALFFQDQTAADRMTVEITTCFVDEETFRALLAENGLSEEEYLDPEHPLALAFNAEAIFDMEQEKYVQIDLLRDAQSTAYVRVHKEIEGYYYSYSDVNEAGERVCCFYPRYDGGGVLEIPTAECCTECTMQSGYLLTEKPFFLDRGSFMTFIYPNSAKSTIFPADFKSMGEDDGSFFLTTQDHTACAEALEKTLLDRGLDTAITDYAAYAEEDRNIVAIIKVFAYGFIVIISLIAAANVFNTISTNIALRRREFAMLRSIGMTSRDFRRMMHYECLLYGTKALALGLPVSFGVTYLIHKAVNEGYAADFRLPWNAIAIAVLSVFAVVFATMLYSMSKVNQENTIDALKNENL